ncbi:maturase [Capsulimonas corticalis]|uniref:Maturase n=1 Tax=Capsulimonas corticalis TaxID=2219043 RepID=A0A402CUG2_9BACT|nr:reverse transcriptase/maturase family protein [Capsulimonas corticalis]BDI28947.1 maturase [Capsulimonas corticalis]
MRTAEDVLNIIRDRGQRKLPLEDVYRQLYNPDLYLRAYGRIYRNDGAMTPGTTEDTVDGMSMARINAIIEDLRYERYRWTPVRRTHIPKKNGKTRPLGIPTWTDKLLQEVMRSILEAYYEPQFSNHSHGFRPKRGCHTALTAIARTWVGTKWFVEGDIKGCFDNINHQILLEVLKKDIHDNRFIKLVEGLLQAGYMERWHYNPTLSGTPQGGVISPILANIYLDQLDKFVEATLLQEYNRGNKRRKNPEYNRLAGRAETLRANGDRHGASELFHQYQKLPSTDQYDPNYRRLRYIRYADDFILGFAGPQEEAEEIKQRLKSFLNEKLRLELSEEKTLVTHTQTGRARFLGYEIAGRQVNDKHDSTSRRTMSSRIGLLVPVDVINDRCSLYAKNGKPIHRAERVNDDDFTIISDYQSEYRGYVQYYQLAENIAWLQRLYWYMHTSLLKTLAHKHKATVNAIAQRYIATIDTEHGPRKVIQCIVPREGKTPLEVHFGGLALRQAAGATIYDQTTHAYVPKRTELVKRLLADKCEICESAEKVEVHHIRKLADLKVKGQKEKPLWMQIMAARKRKTLVVCQKCHDDIQYGKPIRAQSKT